MNDAQLPSQYSKSQHLYWILQIGGWGLYTLVRIIAAPAVLQVSWGRSAVELSIFGAVGLAISHWLRDFMRRHKWAELSIPRLSVHIVVAAFIVSTPLGIATQFSDLSVFQDPTLELRQYVPGVSTGVILSVQIVLQIANWAFLYTIWLAIYFAVIGLREYRTARLNQSETARALQLAELRLLKSQLNPHFLFNALNTVRSLIADNPARAQSAVTRLANTLRYSLSSRQEELVTLSQELDIVSDYLQLESMRFEDRLRIETHVADEATAVHIPVMLLQTLVENAIKHGIAELPSGGLLRISAVLRNECLVLEVENPRSAAPAGAAAEGVGLRNARDRLRLLFGARATLDLDLSSPTVATARLCVPQRP
jgi:Histidine kinase